MTVLGPSVDEAIASKDAEYVELRSPDPEEEGVFSEPVAALPMPVPLLFSAAQAAMEAGAWAEAYELLREVVWLEPGFGQDGVAARELLTRARREYARATRRGPTVGPWPLLLSAAVLVLVPLIAGFATGTLQISFALPVATPEAEPPTVAPVAVPTAAVVQSTLEPTAAPLVGVLPLARPATPTRVPTRVPVTRPSVRVPAPEPDRSELAAVRDQLPATAMPVPTPPATATPEPTLPAAPLPAAPLPAAPAPVAFVPAAPVPAAVQAMQVGPTVTATEPPVLAEEPTPTAVPAPQVVARAQEQCDTYEDPATPCALADGAVLGAYIRSPGGRNYFWFGVPFPDMHVSIRLTDLPADYDLYLFSDQVADPSQPILRSVMPDTSPETIDAVLHDVGTYAIEVVDDPTVPNVPDVPYALAFGLQPAPAPTLEPTPLPLPTPMPTAAAPSLLSVPAVVGQSTSNASRLMREAGLVVEVATVDAFSPAGTGTVASQDPPSAARVAPGSTVRLGIASGRVAIPSVRGKPETEAYATLRAAGFDIQTRRRADDGVASGLALGTNPGEGTLLAPGSPLELLISQGH